MTLRDYHRASQADEGIVQSLLNTTKVGVLKSIKVMLRRMQLSVCRLLI